MNYTDYIVCETCKLLAIDSPTGYTGNAAKFAFDELTAMGYEMVEPQGAFYMFPKSPVADEKVFCEAAKKYHILIVPGSTFACPGYFRLAFCVAKETVLNSLEGFRQLALEFGLTPKN